MSLKAQFAMDSKKELEGVKIEYAANKDGSIPSFTLARMAANNSKYVKAMERACRPYKRLIDLNSLDEAIDKRIMLGVFIDTILLGWENVQLEDDGNNMAFNSENAKKVFAELPELYSDLRSKAQDASNYRADELEKDAKN